MKIWILSLMLALSTSVFAKGKKNMNPTIEMKTSAGTLKLRLNGEKAPETVKNFLSYVEDKFYDGTIFHRVIQGFMIQGGGFTLNDGKMAQKDTKKPIKNEAKNGLKNNRGTIAMARTSDPHSATAQFFINHKNNSNLDYPSFDGWGYAVFGNIIGEESEKILDKIAAVKTTSKEGHENVPVEPVKILSVKVIEDEKKDAPKAKKVTKK